MKELQLQWLMTEEEIKKLLEEWNSSGANKEMSFAAWLNAKGS
jgi:hypothetical protein